MAKLASIEFGRSDFKLTREDSNSAPAKDYNYSVWKDNKIDWSCAICALPGNKSVPVSVSLEWYDRTLWKCIFFYFTTNHHFLWKLIILTWLCFNVSIDNAGLRALFPPNNPSFLIIAKIKLFLRNSRHSSSPIASPPHLPPLVDIFNIFCLNWRLCTLELTPADCFDTKIPAWLERTWWRFILYKATF